MVGSVCWSQFGYNWSILSKKRLGGWDTWNELRLSLLAKLTLPLSRGCHGGWIFGFEQFGCTKNARPSLMKCLACKASVFVPMSAHVLEFKREQINLATWANHRMKQIFVNVNPDISRWYFSNNTFSHCGKVWICQWRWMSLGERWDQTVILLLFF